MLLGVIVHNKALGSSSRSRHHHRHKRTHHTSHPHDHTHQQHKKPKMEVGIGSVTPPENGPESPRKPSSTTPILADQIPSTNITHFSAGLNNDVLSSAGLNSIGLNSEELSDGAKESTSNVGSDDEAYSPSDNVEKPTAIATNNTDTLNTTTTLTTTDTIIAPALSPNTMSRLQSLIETVKESIATMPTVKQEEPSPIEEPPPPPVQKVEEDENTTKSAYVFHETLPPNVAVPVATITMTTTASSVVNQQPVSGFYGNPDVHPHQPLYGSGDPSQFDHHGYQEPRRRWSPYKGKWSPNGR